MLGTLTNLLEGFLPKIPEERLYIMVEDEAGKEERCFNKDLIEKWFCFCSVWAFGGGCAHKDGHDWRFLWRD